MEKHSEPHFLRRHIELVKRVKDELGSWGRLNQLPDVRTALLLPEELGQPQDGSARFYYKRFNDWKNFSEPRRRMSDQRVIAIDEQMRMLLAVNTKMVPDSADQNVADNADQNVEDNGDRNVADAQVQLMALQLEYQKLEAEHFRARRFPAGF